MARDLLASKSTKTGIVEKLGDYWGKLDTAKATAKAKEFLDRGGSVMGFSLGASREGPPNTTNQAVRRRPSWQSWQIVLLIDEAQQIKPGNPNAGFGTLIELHQGMVQAHLSFCAFGLPGTLLSLGEVGVSRLSSNRSIRLGGIDQIAARQMVSRCFKSFKVLGGDPWCEAILERSANWPQHLAVHLNAAIRKIHGASPNMNAEHANLEAAMQEGDSLRARYYEQRLDRLRRRNFEFGNLARGLARLLDKPNSQLPAADLTGAVRAVSPDISHNNIIDFVQDAEQSGFLMYDDYEDAYFMPIPTFAGHLLGKNSPQRTN